MSELDPRDRAVVERVFGQEVGAAHDVVLVLRTLETQPSAALPVTDVPSWFNVLEGLSDSELAEVNAAIEQPVKLAHTSA